MKILALDTTTEACSAALQSGNDIHDLYQVAPRRHAELILPMVDDLLEKAGLELAQLDCIAFARGPGAFTGVRLCTSIAQGLAFAAEVPVLGISTLATMAQGYSGDVRTILAAIDARMGEIYWGLFQQDEKHCVQALGSEAVCKPGELEISLDSDIRNHRCLEISLDSDIYGCGTGWGKYEDILSQKTSKHLVGINPAQLPNAKDMLPLARESLEQGKSCLAKQAMPVYLRNKVTG